VSSSLRALALLAAAVVTSTSLTGCGGGSASGSGKKSGEKFSETADLSTCSADAKASPKPYGDGFPTGWVFPPKTIVYNAEDRGADGTIVSGISTVDFASILAFMNKDLAAAGFAKGSGETEAKDAEGEWHGNGFHGRWAIRESAKCPGETVIQVLSAAD
jgi:hypothetical protein